jgi:hypothetical protein
MAGLEDGPYERRERGAATRFRALAGGVATLHCDAAKAQAHPGAVHRFGPRTRGLPPPPLPPARRFSSGACGARQTIIPLRTQVGLPNDRQLV